MIRGREESVLGEEELRNAQGGGSRVLAVTTQPADIHGYILVLNFPYFRDSASYSCLYILSGSHRQALIFSDWFRINH